MVLVEWLLCPMDAVQQLRRVGLDLRTIGTALTDHIWCLIAIVLAFLCGAMVRMKKADDNPNT